MGVSVYDEYCDHRRFGYGTVISSVIKTLTIKNDSGYNLKVRYKEYGGDWTKDTALDSGQKLSFRTDITWEISLNSDGNSDDINIFDGLGYIQYVSGEKRGNNLAANIVTWNQDKSTWMLNPLFDSLDKHDMLLVPHISGEECIITLLKDHQFGRTLSTDFDTFRLDNQTAFDFPLRIQRNKIDGKEQDFGAKETFKAHSTRDFSIADTHMISLNDDGKCDDIKLNTNNGYVEFNPTRIHKSMFGLYTVDMKIWITQAWWNPTVNKWFGSASQSSINNHDNVILQAAGFDTQNRIITLKLSQG